MKLQDLVGVPYTTRGRDLAGADCWGIILLAADGLYGQRLPDYSQDRDSTNAEETAPLFEARNDWQKVPLENIWPGDVLVLRMLGVPMHAAIYIDNGKFLHTLGGRNSCIDRISTQGWANRIEGVYRWVKS